MGMWREGKAGFARVIGFNVLTAFALILTLYSMPGILSVVSFISALLITLISVLPAALTPIKRRPPISLLFAVLAIPFVLGAIIIAEGVRNWGSFLQIFVAWSLTITFWFNFLMVPLAVYHARLEAARSLPKTMYPPISIIVPAYNEEKVLGATIEALLEADYPAPKEIIVVDDGSTDKTWEVAKRYEPKGVKVFRKPNGGKHSAINFGLLFAKNPIIVTIDADTIIGRNALKELVKPFSDPEVVGVAGNVLVLNKVNFLTKCQALEYVLSINIVRRALDLFGTVPVVPGVLGAFRKSIIESVGAYDSGILTEDFDITIKSLKAGKIVQAASKALAFTEAPETLKDLYRQRLRWYRGNIQTILKHRDIFSTKRYGMLQSLTYPYLIINLFVIPFLTIPVWAAIAFSILQGAWYHVAMLLILFLFLQMLHAALALELSEEGDRGLVLYAPFFVVGYKHLIDAFVIKAVVDVFFRRRVTWTRARRYGWRRISP